MRKQAEIQVISHLIQNPKTYVEYYDLLDVELFKDIDNKKIYMSFKKLVSDSKELDVFSVAEGIEEISILGLTK
jgi:replicative DNA helicase